MKYFLFSLLLLLGVSAASAQSVAVDMGRSFPGSDDLDRYWKNDYSASLTLSIPAHRSISVSPSFSFYSFKFEKPEYLGPGMIRYSSNARHVLHLGINVAYLVPPVYSLSPFVHFGLGYIRFNLEDVAYQITNWEGTTKGIRFSGLSSQLRLGVQANIFERFKPFVSIDYIFGFPFNDDVDYLREDYLEITNISFGLRYIFRRSQKAY